MAFLEDTEQNLSETSGRRSRGLLTVLWQRKALVILPALLGLIGGSLFYWQKAPVYQASAHILVHKKQPERVLPMQGGDPRNFVVDDYMATHVFVLQSPMILERAIKKKDLASLKTFENSGDPVGQIAAGLTITRGGGKDVGANSINIILLSYRGPVPEECGKVLTAVIESYQEFLDITYRNVSDQTLKLITTARDGLGKDLAARQEKYQKFRQEKPHLRRLKDGSNVEMERFAAMEAKRSAWMIRQAELRKDITFLEKAIADGKGSEILAVLTRSMDGKSDNAQKALEDQLLPLKLQEQQLLVSFGDDHPMVANVRKRMVMVRDHFEKNGVEGTTTGDKRPLERHLLVLREDLIRTNLVLQELSKVLDETKNDLKDLDNNQIIEEHMRNDIARTHQLYEGTIKRLEEINLVRDSGGFEARTVAPPGLGVKIAPSALQIITGGLLLGLLVGVGLAFLADFTDKSFRDADEVRTRLGMPILGHVPFLKPDPEVVKKAEAGELKVDFLLYTYHKPKSLEAEAYRAIRTALLFSTSGEKHRVVQLSSPNKGDGKSLTAANLAISLAQSGKNVLVIDADCRRPRQHKIFGIANTAGLVNVLADGVSWTSVVHATEINGLSIIPAGPVPPNPSELLSSPRFANLVETVRLEFDFVIIDTAPLLVVTDPCVVANRVDGLVLVLRLSRQGRPQAERAREILTSLNVKVFGLIINGVTGQGHSGLYSSEHYDYTDAYEQDDSSFENDCGFSTYEEDADNSKKSAE